MELQVQGNMRARSKWEQGQLGHKNGSIQEGAGSRLCTYSLGALLIFIKSTSSIHARVLERTRVFLA